MAPPLEAQFNMYTTVKLNTFSYHETDDLLTCCEKSCSSRCTSMIEELRQTDYQRAFATPPTASGTARWAPISKWWRIKRSRVEGRARRGGVGGAGSQAKPTEAGWRHVRWSLFVAALCRQRVVGRHLPQAEWRRKQRRRWSTVAGPPWATSCQFIQLAPRRCNHWHDLYSPTTREWRGGQRRKESKARQKANKIYGDIN